ncbi:MAG TPA: choice-of-anchor tandem repeat GloVer-containing protein [Verrucomicrobiae bacterium]|nr:choice-of-anchor tandem repeat GloVer-containing protein [Verrucomicrobiae bacterium]
MKTILLYAVLFLTFGLLIPSMGHAGVQPHVLWDLDPSVAPPAGGLFQGQQPEGELLVSTTNYFGTTVYGGTNSMGTIFQLKRDASGSWTSNTIFNFNGVNGSHPYGALITDGNGNLYGTTARGGSHPGQIKVDPTPLGYGTIFQLSPPTDPNPNAAWTLNSFSFNPTFSASPLPLTDGCSPKAGLVEYNPGAMPGDPLVFYGTTQYGGGNGADGGTSGVGLGTVFKATLANGAWSVATIYAFDQQSGNKVRNPVSDLLVEPAGSTFELFGTVSLGGLISNGGGVFKLTNSMVGSQLTWGAAIHPLPGDGSMGLSPLAGLIKATDSNFYGTASTGGNNNAGSIFQFSSGTFRAALLDRKLTGALPSSRVLSYAPNLLIGTAQSGGTNNGQGTIFNIAFPPPSLPAVWQPTLVYSFTNGDCFNPYAGLVQGNDGLLYGTTDSGNVPVIGRGRGAVYQLSPPAPPVCPCGSVPSTDCCTYDICPKTATVPSCDAHGSFTVITGPGCAWTATTTDNRIQLDTPCNPGLGTQVSGVGSGTVTYTMSDATTLNPPSGIITVGGQTFTITQSGISTVGNFVIDPSVPEIDCAGNPVAVHVNIDSCTSWTVTPDPGNFPPQFHILVGTQSGKGPGTFVLYGSTNISSGPLTGKVLLGGNPFKFTQAKCTSSPPPPPNCSIAFSPLKLVTPSDGGGGAVKVLTGPGCRWQVKSSTFELHLDITNGSGPAVINYTVDGYYVKSINGLPPPKSTRTPAITITTQSDTETIYGLQTGIWDKAGP